MNRRARQLSSLSLALAIGAAGGWAAWLFSLPLAWMIGAMTATTLAAVLGAPVALPPIFRTVMIAILGVMLGSRFTPDILDHLAEWTASLAGLLAYTAVAGLASTWYFQRVGGFDRATAYFSAMPGGLSEMVLIGGSLGGDVRVISLAHASRLLLLVASLPIALQVLLGFEPAASPAGPELAALAPLDIAILTACGVAGLFGARALRLPAGAMMGPMVLSAAVHLAGWSDAQPPVPLVAAAQVVIGTAVGCRFAGVAPAMIGRTVALASGSTVILLSTAVGFAFLLAALTGLPPEALVIAFAPGGVAEMSLIAIALAVDPALVATHHLVRIFTIVVLAPALFRRTRPRDGGA